MAERMVARIRTQAEHCRWMGSPLYADLLERVADDVLAGGPAAEVLAGHEDATGAGALPLRLMGGVHALVLAGRVPDLARFYPSAGGTADGEAAWPVLRDVLRRNRAELRGTLDQPPQTNEVGRAAALVGGLLHVTARRPAPVRLLEIGASAGLNLRADLFRIALPDGRGVGPQDSPVVLADPWRGTLPPLGAEVRVVERAGCDTAPLDPSSEQDRLRLMSYVWPDQLDRLERLRGALTLAQRVPAEMTRESARDFVGRTRLVPGTTTVVWHSMMWQYLQADEQRDVLSGIEALGATADEDAGLAHLRLEPAGPGEYAGVLVTLRSWPGGEERVLADAHAHGIPTVWSGDAAD